MSLFRPRRVGAIDPVGITNASASNVLNKKASTKATTTDSIVSLMAEGRTERCRTPSGGLYPMLRLA